MRAFSSRFCIGSATLGAALAASCLINSAEATQYVLIDLGTLTDRSSWGYGINQSGAVCGWSSISGTPGSKGNPAIPFINHAFLWSGGPGGMNDIGAIPSANCSPYGCESLANDINDNGLLVGWSATPYQIPFIWSPRSSPPLNQGINPLPSLFSGDGNSVARAISNSIVIAGECKGPGGIPRRPAKWEHDGTNWIVTDLGTLMANNSGFGGAYDVNNAGQVVGQATHPGGSLSAFLWLPAPAYGLGAGMHDLTPSGSSGLANAINDLGQVVGVIGIAQGWIWLPAPAYGYSAGLHVLPTLSGAQVYPSGINNNGQIIGTAFIVQGSNVINKAALFNPGPGGAIGQWLLLDTLLPPGSPWNLQNYALNADINDAGAMTGDMYSTIIHDINDAPAVHGFVLKPVAPGDINADGFVNTADLLAVINGWGPCPAPCPPSCAADLNADCAVNVADLLIVINNWG